MLKNDVPEDSPLQNHIDEILQKIRDDQGYWNQIEAYIQQHSEAEFSHGICRECAEKLYPDFNLYDD